MLFARKTGPATLIPGVAILFAVYFLYLWRNGDRLAVATPRPAVDDWQPRGQAAFWRNVPVHYPPSSIRPLATGTPVRYPPIQATAFPAQPQDARRQAVKQVFAKCWRSYRELAWGADELTPVSGGRRDPFGGWAATLVDSLDTLWIMDMKAEFAEAVAAAEAINFTHSTLDQVNVFETNIRFLGGFLSAFDLSGDARLLRKAVEVGDMLYKAFDTTTRMPITRWDIRAAARGERQAAPASVLLAEIGSLSLEFTRLSMLTGDARWFDAAQRIADAMAAQQDSTALPGLWPLTADAAQTRPVFDAGSLFTLGAMADSAYEYLPKMAALLGGRLPGYQAMYEKAADAAARHNLFRPLTPTDADILVAGIVHVGEDGSTELEPQAQHLACFLGGMFALGGRLFGREKDMDVAQRLVDGCIWSYKALPHGVMPETFYLAPCPSPGGDCRWDEAAWKREVVRRAGKDKKETDDDDDDANNDDDPTGTAAADAIIAEERLPPGITAITDRRYVLRPEAAESVFVLYRATGRAELLEAAWAMFEAIDAATTTPLANSAVHDVTEAADADGKPQAADAMESFWMAETLKYFYLVFSEPGLVSLDEFVFNTEAHPFRRLVR
ncbi:glycoside hydrolase family 47 protein [Thermothielavioides terrestris NRRL 8126]|uniref:alpha-1,2-Mannosidase n=1 Tax=Thermothielavioides terrestris (strain ATCC 38088 / NRRL 8126) TaxID=578455 RepID=G2RF13_THETT|nr:glycoside hydrolase family 47 protein [Thermothielavioides terrestris NRRL 8126]AEO70296.1 glycoside hydrolase family 47 protein [Thermothielavioides terrestris NRRL 8126]